MLDRETLNSILLFVITASGAVVSAEEGALWLSLSVMGRQRSRRRPARLQG